MDTGKSSALTVYVYELRMYGKGKVKSKGKGKGELYPTAGHEDPERSRSIAQLIL